MPFRANDSPRNGYIAFHNHVPNDGIAARNPIRQACISCVSQLKRHALITEFNGYPTQRKEDG